MPRCVSVLQEAAWLICRPRDSSPCHGTVVETLNMCPMTFLLRIHQECIAGTRSLHNINSIRQAALHRVDSAQMLHGHGGFPSLVSSPKLVRSFCAHSGPSTRPQASLYTWRPGHRVSLFRQQWGQCVLSTQQASPQNGLEKHPWNSHLGCPSC